MSEYTFKQWYFCGEYREEAAIEFECESMYLGICNIMNIASGILHRDILMNPEQQQRQRVVELAGMHAYDFRIKATTAEGVPKRFMCQVKFRKA